MVPLHTCGLKDLLNLVKVQFNGVTPKCAVFGGAF